MHRALVIKELRENAGIAALALLASFYGVTRLTGYELLFFSEVRPPTVPFVNGWFYTFFICMAVCLAIGLGLRQSVWESIQGTYLFLLHRPLSRERIIGTKLLIGLAIYLICMLIPLLVYALWAATPGMHTGPFEWSMTLNCWKVWYASTGLYLAAFLSGIRPARWFGSRLFPLIAVIPAVSLLMTLPGWRPWELLLLLLLNGLLVVAILHVSRTRDYP